jgi:hypothetical protein
MAYIPFYGHGWNAEGTKRRKERKRERYYPPRTTERAVILNEVKDLDERSMNAREMFHSVQHDNVPAMMSMYLTVILNEVKDLAG